MCIYIYRERERDRERCIYIYINIDVLRAERAQRGAVGVLPRERPGGVVRRRGLVRHLGRLPKAGADGADASAPRVPGEDLRKHAMF